MADINVVDEILLKIINIEEINIYLLGLYLLYWWKGKKWEHIEIHPYLGIIFGTVTRQEFSVAFRVLAELPPHLTCKILGGVLLGIV